MSAEDEGRTTLPRVLLALPGERLRDQLLPAPILFSFLFICGFSALNCLPHPLNWGIIATTCPPARAQLISGVYLLAARQQKRTLQLPPLLLGHRQPEAMEESEQEPGWAGDSGHGLARTGSKQPLPCTEASPGICLGHRCSWQSSGGGPKPGCSLKVFPELGKGRSHSAVLHPSPRHGGS